VQQALKDAHWADDDLVTNCKQCDKQFNQLSRRKVCVTTPSQFPYNVVIIVGKVEHGHGFFAAGDGQTNEFSLFKVDSICACGSFSIGRLDHYHMVLT